MGAHYVKAFGTISAQSLASQAKRTPERAVLFCARDDDQAADVVERLISAAGFQPVKVGGVDQALRIEVFGELHDLGGQEGKLLEAERPHAALAASA
jgi:predicted dinucleotide-binding enzyme